MKTKLEKLLCATPVAPGLILMSYFIKILFVVGFVFLIYKIIRSKNQTQKRNKLILLTAGLLALCLIWYLLIPNYIFSYTARPISSDVEAVSLQTDCGSKLNFIYLFR